MSREEKFSGKIGFILATSGSAIGLANVWRFPYLVGSFGGGKIIFCYLIFLIMSGLPLFLSEVFLGKTTGKGPQEAFYLIGKSPFWKKMGSFTVLTGFMISTFYSVVAGWVLGYFWESLLGSHAISTLSEAETAWNSHVSSALWCLRYHFAFMLLAYFFVRSTVQEGIERCSRIFMPIFFVCLIMLLIESLMNPGSFAAFSEMASFSQQLKPMGLMIALGHAFFTLSVGQGTLCTYGSYLKTTSSMGKASLVVLAADTLVSLICTFCILSVIASFGASLTFGPGLLFQTLPTIFAHMNYGHILGALFFLLVTIAALTSQVSALEPPIQWCMSNWKLSRTQAATTVCLASLAIGIPSALSTNLLSNFKFFETQTIFDVICFTTTSIMVPLGALASSLLVGWNVKTQDIQAFLFSSLTDLSFAISQGLLFCLRYLCPSIVILVFLDGLGYPLF